MRVTWPLAAIIVAAVAGVTVILSVSDPATRSAVIGLMVSAISTLAAVYARKGSSADADEITRKVLHELGIVKGQVNGRMSELIRKVPDPPAGPSGPGRHAR